MENNFKKIENKIQETMIQLNIGETSHKTYPAICPGYTWLEIYTNAITIGNLNKIAEKFRDPILTVAVTNESKIGIIILFNNEIL